MMRTGGCCASIARTCTGLVCVRSSSCCMAPFVGGEPGGGGNGAERLAQPGERAALPQVLDPRRLDLLLVTGARELLPCLSEQCIDPLDHLNTPSEMTKAAPVPRRGLVANCLEGLRRGALDDRGKRLRVDDRDVREHLAVQRDLRLLQAGDEARVGDAVQARSRVDTGDPQ